MAKREEIRITNPPPKLYKSIVSMAAKNKRSVAKQAELMLEEYLELKKIK
jgi:hypothetical protein